MWYNVLHMEEINLNQSVNHKSAVILISLVTVLCFIIAAILVWPRTTPPKQLGTSQPPPPAPEFYGAPIFTPGDNPGIIITPTPVGERPPGFPTDLEFYDSTEIFQAYQATRQDAPGFHDTVVYASIKPHAEIITDYAKMLRAKGFSPRLSPLDAPQALTAEKDDQSYNITAIKQGEQTLVTVSYVERKK